MKNYMMIDGKKINISDETVKELREAYLADSVTQYINKLDGEQVYGECSSRIIVKRVSRDTFIKLPLPNANAEWSFSVWEQAKKIVKDITKLGRHAYPYHTNKEDYKYVVIKIV